MGRNNIAAVDALSGVTTSWNPDAWVYGSVSALAVNGAIVYAGGYFTSIGGQTRNDIAALDAGTGAATAWNPVATINPVRCLTASATTVYAGGQFSDIGGQSRSHIAALDAATGAATMWDPGTDAPVDALVLYGGRLLVGGEFFVIAGQPQQFLASLSPSGADGPVATDIALISAGATPSRVILEWYEGGGSRSNAGVERRLEGEAWRPLGTTDADGSGNLRFEDNSVSPGMRYAYRLNYTKDGLVVHSAESWVTIPTASRFALAGASPNPALGHDLRITFSLPSARPAKLELYDPTGRRIAATEVGSLGEGEHSLRLRPNLPIAPGMYWVRLSQAALTAASRIVVVD